MYKLFNILTELFGKPYYNRPVPVMHYKHIPRHDVATVSGNPWPFIQPAPVPGDSGSLFGR